MRYHVDLPGPINVSGSTKVRKSTSRAIVWFLAVSAALALLVTFWPLFLAVALGGLVWWVVRLCRPTPVDPRLIQVQGADAHARAVHATAVAGDRADHLAATARQHDAWGLHASAGQYRRMAAEARHAAPPADGSQWLPPGARPPRYYTGG